MYAHVCMHMFVCTCVYAHVCMSVLTKEVTNTRPKFCVCTHMYVCICIFVLRKEMTNTWPKFCSPITYLPHECACMCINVYVCASMCMYVQYVHPSISLSPSVSYTHKYAYIRTYAPHCSTEGHFGQMRCSHTSPHHHWQRT
jgi:hypothetical protein